MTPTTIKSIRAALQLTQAQLAERLGITRPYLVMLETGKRRPSATLIKLLNMIHNHNGER